MTINTIQNTLTTVLLLCGLIAQSQSIDWVKSNGSTDREYTILSKLDTDGNVYIVGSYTETLNYENYSLSHLGEGDVFIEKKNTDGTILWVKNLSSINEEKALGIAVTADGGIAIAGAFKGTLDANPGNDIYNLVSNGDYDIYIMKLSSEGDFVWAKSYGSLEAEYLSDIEVDNVGNILMNISFQTSLQLSSTVVIESPNALITLSNGLVKLDANANIIWAYSTGSTFVNDIAFDNDNNIYLGGYFIFVVDFDYKEDTFIMTETGSALHNFPLNFDGYIQKLDSNANFIWAKQLKDPFNLYVHSITVDNDHNVYTSGIWQGASSSLDFDPGSEVYTVDAPDTTSSKQFIHKLNNLQILFGF